MNISKEIGRPNNPKRQGKDANNFMKNLAGRWKRCAPLSCFFTRCADKKCQECRCKGDYEKGKLSTQIRLYFSSPVEYSRGRESESETTLGEIFAVFAVRQWKEICAPGTLLDFLTRGKTISTNFGNTTLTIVEQHPIEEKAIGACTSPSPFSTGRR
jgi:hypothetical protein